VHDKRRFKSLQDVWPQGPEALLKDLERLGFEARIANLAALTAAWPHLNIPASVDGVPSDRGYAYVQKLPRAPEGLSSWGLLFVEKGLAGKVVFDSPLIEVKLADAAMDFVLTKIAAEEWTGRSGTAPKGVQMEGDAHIGPDCDIGEGTIIEAGVRIGARVSIGKNSRIRMGTRIGDDCVLGEGCDIGPHVSIGSNGFGFVKYPQDKSVRQRRHVGRVVMGDRVRAGAFTSFDRGVFDDTVIGSGCAFDNHVQVAHNCKIGDNSILCAFVGLSGSTEVGHNVTIAGMVGTKGHLRIGNNVTIAGLSGVTQDVEDGAIVKGNPVRPLAEALKIQSLTTRLPELYDRLKKLEDKT
jgi:UDP-3-O-[3-hydroxymyristoyl] glucosamine N-acyltransferase